MTTEQKELWSQAAYELLGWADDALDRRQMGITAAQRRQMEITAAQVRMAVDLGNKYVLLESYAQHAENCNRNRLRDNEPSAKVCNCGLDAVLEVKD